MNMRFVRQVSVALLVAVTVTGCHNLQLGDTRIANPASTKQGILRTQLEQALFNEIILRFTATHPGPLGPIDYQTLLTELQQTVALTEITSLQQQTLDAVRWSAQSPAHETPAPALDRWVEQELAALRRLRASLDAADPGLFQTVGPTRAARQQFLGLIETSIETHRVLNPLGLRFSDLPPLLVKPSLLDLKTAFFYQPDDASIRITDAQFTDLSFPEAEVIALIHGLPGSHFLMQQPRTPLFAEVQAENQKAMAILMLAAMGHVEFYQTPYSQIARIDFLTLRLAQYQKALQPAQTFEQFKAAIGLTHYRLKRLQQAFVSAETLPRALVMQGQALRSLSAATALSISVAQTHPAPLTNAQRSAILSQLTRLAGPIDAP